MKNEVYLKRAHHTGRHSDYFSQKVRNGPTQMQRWKANICFHSHLSKAISTDVIQPISPSSTAFNQWLCLMSLFERKHCFHSSLKMSLPTLFSLTSKLLWFKYRCTRTWHFLKSAEMRTLHRGQDVISQLRIQLNIRELGFLSAVCS